MACFREPGSTSRQAARLLEPPKRPRVELESFPRLACQTRADIDGFRSLECKRLAVLDQMPLQQPPF